MPGTFREDAAALLRVNGRLPRRAVVLADGTLGDRGTHPDAREVIVLSKLCELCRQDMGQPWYPRHTSDLLDMALSTNSPGAWDAVRDDMDTGDFDVRAAAGVIGHDRNPEALVSCLSSAKQERHFLSVLCAVSRVLPELSAETRDELGRALGFMLEGVVDSLGKHASVLSRDIADVVLAAVAKMVAATGVPDARVADLVENALRRRRYEALRVFVQCPTTYLKHRPQVLGMLLESARAERNAYPMVAMLARIAAEAPGLLATHREAIADLGASALKSTEAVDSRTCMAVGTLVRSCAGFDTIAQALATALCACAAALAPP